MLFLNEFKLTSVFSVNILLKQFYNLLLFKWQIDYFITKDKLCKNHRWTKFEAESLRYTLSNYLYNINDKTFENLRTDNIITVTVLSTYFAIILCVLLTLLIIYPGLSTLAAFLIFLSLYITITTINSLFAQNLNEISTNILDSNSDIHKYFAVYKIVSAMMVISDLKNDKLEFSYTKLNDEGLTLDKILERNIASYENINQTSKIVQIKLAAYRNLDFLKYIVFDKLSPYYLKYFDNVYVKLPNTDENNFITDLYRNHYGFTANNETIMSYLQKIRSAVQTAIKEEDVKVEDVKIYMIKYLNDNGIYDDTKADSVNTTSIINAFNAIDRDFMLQPMQDKTLSETVKSHLDSIKKILGKYQIVNDLISKVLKTSETCTWLSVPDNDYIKYYIENKDVLTDSIVSVDDGTQQIINKTMWVGDFVYAYFVFLAIAFFIVSHMLYMNINSTLYVYILLAILFVYIIFIWLYTHQSFFDY